MKLHPIASALLLSIPLSTVAQTANEIERLEVSGTRTPLYDTRDVNAAALGIKDPLTLPISIQSFSQELIDNQLSKTLSDVLANDASVQNSSIGSVFDFVSLRGFQLDWNNGLRRDGLALAPYQDVPLENIQRIDVLKGPSGLVSGFNNPGGTVNYVTKRPTQESFIEINAELNSRDSKYLHLDMGGRVSANSDVGYRLNVAVEDNGDFSAGDDQQRYFASVAFDWQAHDDFLLRLDMDFQDKSIVSQPLLGLANNAHAEAVLPPYVDMSDVLLGQPWARYDTQTLNIGGRADYWINDNWQWINQVAYSKNDRFTVFPDIYAVNRDGDVLKSMILVTPDESYESLSAHSFISGEATTGDVRHELVLGVSTRQLKAIDGRWFELDNPVGNIFAPIHLPKPVFPQIPDANLTETVEKSLFITDIVHFNEQFYATLGLRYLSYQREITAPKKGMQRTDDDSYITPTVGFNYTPNENLAFYVAYSDGVGEGGVAVIGSGALNEGEHLGSQKSEQLEVGAKYRVGSTTFTGALFEIEKSLEYHNRVTNYFVQDGVQTHRGFELNINGEVTDDLSVIFSATLMDAEIDELQGQTDINGNQPPNVPKSQANLFIDYQFQQLSALQGLSANLGVFYVGERQQNLNSSLQLPGYTRFDIGIRYDFVDPNWVVRLKVENMFDTEYWSSAGAKGIDWGVMPGNGRQWALSLTHSF